MVQHSSITEGLLRVSCDIAPIEWVDHKADLRLHEIRGEEFAGTTMVARLDFASLNDLNLDCAGADIGSIVLTQ